MKSTSVLLALGSALVAHAQQFPTEYSNPLEAKVLLYTYTDGFRHDSIPTAIESLKTWGPYWNITFDATEDQSKFNAANLAQYDAVLCVHTTGNIFTTAGQAAFSDYLSKGGNFAGIHAASAGYLDKIWAPYTDSIGATFDHHPKFQPATFVKEMQNNPATDASPDRWSFGEEVYSFTTDPRKKNGVKLLWSVDPTSYNESDVDTVQGSPHPIAWIQDYNAGAVIKGTTGVAGRSFYSSLGHANSTWHDETFMKHVLGGLIWTFSSNTTRVAAGLYNGAQPTVHTGSTNNVTSATTTTWAPVLGSNATAPPPPPPIATATSSGSGPEATGGSGSSSSGAINVRSGMGWAIVVALLGFSSL